MFCHAHHFRNPITSHQMIQLENNLIAKWIKNLWAGDYFRFDDIKADFKVISFERVDNTLLVKMSFAADESKKGVDSDSLVLFRYDPESHLGFLPNQVKIVTLLEKYVWANTAACDALSDHISEETLDVSVEYIGWDDPRLSEEVVKVLVDGNDHYAIADTLIKLHNAKVELPQFVPERLKFYFNQMINDFK